MRTHADIMRDLSTWGVTVEDVARAWASVDGKRDEFDRGKSGDDADGHFDGYMIEAEILLDRAVHYASNRKILGRVK